MYIETFINGPFMINTYLLIDEDNNGIIIDPGHDCTNLLSEIKSKKINVEAILITHAHIDHIAGIGQIKDFLQDVKVYSSKHSQKYLDNLSVQAMFLGMAVPEGIEIDTLLEEKTELEIKSFKIETIYVPGHSSDSLCYYLADENILFAGDTLFKGVIGRTDLMDGNYEQLITSIKKNLLSLPEDTIVYSGHGDETSIKYEKENNPYLN